jgi:hypothetical protein
MKFPVALEFSEEFIFDNNFRGDADIGPIGFADIALTKDLPRLTTAYSKPGEPAGGERMICRTVGALLRLEMLTVPPPQPPPIPPALQQPTWGLYTTAALMGSYGGKIGLIQQHSLGPVALGYETTGTMHGPNPMAIGDSLSLYTVTNMSAGAYGFDYFTSYANLMDSIFLRVQVIRASDAPDYFKSPVKLRAKGVLLATDPA